VKGRQKRRLEIREELIGQTGKRALLVEGTDDVSLFRILLLRKWGAEWESDWVLADVGSKKIVTDILAQETDWLGIVDRDEWTDEVITAKQDELENLFVLPRFCMESYAVDPDELWEALPQKMQGKVAGGLEVLTSDILRDMGKWLRHGVLWSAINPLWGGLRALGFKEKLLDFDVAQNDDIIKETLNEWHGYLNPDQIFQSFADKLNQVSGLPVKEQLHKWIHGKQFFLEHVHPVLNKYLGQNDAQSRIMEVFRSFALPEDLEPLWSRIQPA
jgi:hypothetical protein